MNNFMTLSMLPNSSGRGTAIETKHPVKDARGLSAATAHIAEEMTVDAHDWRILASEWLALTAAVEQFEQEFERLEQNFNHCWKQRAGVNGGRRASN